MKILHYSDKKADNFQQLYDQCDALVTTGDLSLFDFPGLRDLSIADRKPAFGVYGNHDSGLYFEELGIKNLHNQVVDFAGYQWGGFQGCLQYKRSDLMYTEEQAKEFADNFPYVDILLLHAGPLNLLDDPGDDVHRGSAHLKRYVLEKQPKYVFVGHQYSEAEMEIGNTKIYRAFGARLMKI